MDPFHTYLQKRVEGALKLATTAGRKEEEKITKAEHDIAFGLEAIRQKKRDAEAKREEIQGIVDKIKLKGEEMDVLIASSTPPPANDPPRQPPPANDPRHQNGPVSLAPAEAS
jgi:translation elongation factor EF-1beta